MKERLLFIIKLLLKVKFIFKSPQRHEVVIFDGEIGTLKDLENLISNYNFFILQNRIENINKVHLSFQVIKMISFNLLVKM